MELVPCSSSDASRSADASGKCQICFQPSHGRHYGAETCRACAAFFRRYHVPKGPLKQVRTLKCRQKTNECKPHSNGSWYCKKCRLKMCYTLGMKPDNIQLNRDVFHSATGFESIPETVERVLGKPHVVLVLQRDVDPNREKSYVDLTQLVEIVESILRTPPVLNQKMSKMNTLERLTFGLRQVRNSQMTHNVGRMECFGREQMVGMWKNGLVNAAKWLMYSDEFRALDHNDKFSVLKCVWHVFSRLERIAMTAEMRVKRFCGSRQFVFSQEEVLDFENSRTDVRWLTDLALEELTFFLGPLSSWFNDQLVNDFIDVQPSDMELTFMLCNLCFHLTGKSYNGSIESYKEQLQEVLANDLHEYYTKQDETLRYSHRLAKLLSINKEYQKLMHRRYEKAYVGHVLQAFKIDFSHPEVFQHSF